MEKDEWGSNPEHHFIKNSLGQFGKVTIFEPCNYASNVAYYHSATAICNFDDWSPNISTETKRAFVR